jgi:hypothetical protein
MDWLFPVDSYCPPPEEEDDSDEDLELWGCNMDRAKRYPLLRYADV